MARILVVGMNFEPELTGVGKYTGELVRHLVARGHDVEVVTTPPHYPGWRVQAPFGNRFSVSEEPGLRVTRCPLLLRSAMRGIWRLVAPVSFAVTAAPVTLWRALTRKPDVVLCVEPTLLAAPAALLAAWLRGARTALHVQDLEVDAAFAVGHLGGGGRLRRLAMAFERFCLRRFDRVITISNRMADALRAKRGGDAADVVVVRNWVDVEHIRPEPRDRAYCAALGLDPDRFIALYSGNIGAKQGLDLLIEAARLLADEPRIQIAIAGDGPARDELKRAAEGLDGIVWLDFQPYARLGSFLSLPDLHLLPQRADAADLVLPSKLGGMLASGRPILVTAEPGTELAEFLDGATDIVPPGDAVAFADAVRRRLAAADDPALEAAARRRLLLAQSLAAGPAIDRFDALLTPAVPAPQMVEEAT